MNHYYKLLGVTPSSSLVEIKSAYKQKAKLYHPDVNKSPNAGRLFIEVTAAYEWLITNFGKPATPSAPDPAPQRAPQQSPPKNAQPSPTDDHWTRMAKAQAAKAASNPPKPESYVYQQRAAYQRPKPAYTYRREHVAEEYRPAPRRTVGVGDKVASFPDQNRVCHIFLTEKEAKCGGNFNLFVDGMKLSANIPPGAETGDFCTLQNGRKVVVIVNSVIGDLLEKE